MATQIRITGNDTVHISGYVNAVDRFSRPMPDDRGKMFVEKIMPGAFAEAINRAEDIGVMIDHVVPVTTVSESGATLKEDAVGLFFDGDIRSREITEKAENGQLKGWSFGFYLCDNGWKDEECEEEFVDYRRIISELDLVEVSIIDDKALPAYPATSIYARSTDEKRLLMLRSSDEDIEIKNEFQLSRNLEKLQERKAELEKYKTKNIFGG